MKILVIFWQRLRRRFCLVVFRRRWWIWRSSFFLQITRIWRSFGARISPADCERISCWFFRLEFLQINRFFGWFFRSFWRRFGNILILIRIVAPNWIENIGSLFTGCFTIPVQVLRSFRVLLLSGFGTCDR